MADLGTEYDAKSCPRPISRPYCSHMFHVPMHMFHVFHVTIHMQFDRSDDRWLVKSFFFFLVSCMEAGRNIQSE